MKGVHLLNITPKNFINSNFRILDFIRYKLKKTKKPLQKCGGFFMLILEQK